MSWRETLKVKSWKAPSNNAYELKTLQDRVRRIGRENNMPSKFITLYCTGLEDIWDLYAGYSDKKLLKDMQMAFADKDLMNDLKNLKPKIIEDHRDD